MVPRVWCRIAQLVYMSLGESVLGVYVEVVILENCQLVHVSLEESFLGVYFEVVHLSRGLLKNMIALNYESNLVGKERDEDIFANMLSFESFNDFEVNQVRIGLQCTKFSIRFDGRMLLELRSCQLLMLLILRLSMLLL
ncbi:hypothetical protein ACSQ67_021278 [Phaseolus vulgaris]